MFKEVCLPWAGVDTRTHPLILVQHNRVDKPLYFLEGVLYGAKWMLDFVMTLYRPAGADGLHGVPLVLREHLRAVLFRFKRCTYRQEGNRLPLRRQIPVR